MIRARREDDLDRCVALLREVHEIDRYPVFWPADPVDWLTGRDSLFSWVDEGQDGRLLGHLSLHGTDAELAKPAWRDVLPGRTDRFAVVSRFFVSPAMRRQGVGGALIGHAEEHAGANGLRLVLDVAEHNQDAIAFYERRGWRRVGTAELPLSGEPWTLALVLFVLDR